jgi:hypothetical protein
VWVEGIAGELTIPVTVALEGQREEVERTREEKVGIGERAVLSYGETRREGKGRNGYWWGSYLCC